VTPKFDNHPIFKQGDWKCPMCGNINWERRDTCNVCQTKKPGTAPAEERTGKGGGFNERQDQPSRRHAEDDGEEYDDLGRKKRKQSDRDRSPRRSDDRSRGRSRSRSRERRRSRSRSRDRERRH